MKKALSLPVLTAGIFTLFAPVASAAIIQFSQEVTFSLNSNDPAPLPNSIQLPQYDAAANGGFPLRSVRLIAEGNTTGSYLFTNNGGTVVFNLLTVGATTPIDVPSNNPATIPLTPFPSNTFTNVTVNPNTAFFQPLAGSDTRERIVPLSDFALYEGTGNLTFPITATLLIISSANFAPPTDNSQLINLSATTRLTVIYENDAPPLEIPERGFSFLSLVLCGLAGLALKTYGKSV